MRASRFLLATTLMCAALPAAAARLPFGFGGESYSVPTWVRSFAIGDFDEDGRDDVIAVLENGSVLQWHAAPDGILEPVTPPALGAPARSVAVLKSNADEHLDIAIGLASTPPAVVVLLGAGNGSFSNWATLDSQSNVDQLKAADLDGDGKTDLVGVSPDASLIRSWLSLGGGTFGARVDSPGASGVFAFDVGVLDQDGIADLALATYASGSTPFLLMRGTAAGAFSTITTVPLLGEMYSVSIADLDADGANDVVVGYLKGPVVLWGDGAGGVADRDTLQGLRSYAESPALVLDVNGDNMLDVVSTGTFSYGNWFGVHVGTGGRNFAPAIEHELWPDPDGTYFRQLERGEFDGDGEPDMIVFGKGRSSFGSSRDFTLFHHGGPLFKGAVEYTLEDSTRDIALASRGMNTPKQLVFRSADRIARLVPRAHGLIVASDAITIGPSSTFHLADLDQDGDDDLIVDQPGGVAVAAQASDGSFGAFTPYAIGNFLTIADVDGDGDRDLVSEQPAGMFAVSLNNGAGSFLAPNPWGAIPSQPLAWAAGDWNRDTFEDLATTRNVAPTALMPDSITVLLSNGSSAFDVHAVVPILEAPGVLSLLPLSLAAGDLDRDGDPDLVSMSYLNNSGRYATYLNDGTGGFAPAFLQRGPIEEAAQHLVLDDFNGDQKLDAAGVAFKDGLLTFDHALGVGDGQFDDAFGRLTALWTYAGPNAPGGDGRSLDSGDLDGDGMPELVALASGREERPGNNRILVFYNAAPPPEPTAVTISLASSTVENGRVKLAWLVLGDPARAMVERVEGAGAWRVLGAATVSGDRRSFEDASVVAGHTYRYRLAMWGGDRVTRSPEVAILVPGAARLGFVSLAPMPAGRELTVRFTAPSSAPVRVEMFDIGGRRVLDRSAQVDVAGAGTMMLSLDRTHAGIYWMRLTQGVERVQARVAVVR